MSESATKVCPYCAETIKAAAVKCRYCHSDLTDAPPSAEAPGPPTEPVVSNAPPPPPPADQALVVPAPRRTPLALRKALPVWLVGVVAALLVTSLVFAGLAVKAWMDTKKDDDAQEAADATRALVADKVKALLSYDYQHFDKLEEAAKSELTDDFEKKFDPYVEELRDTAIEQKRSQTADVVAVGVLSASASKVELLLFVDRTSTTKGSGHQSVYQDRVNVTMVKSGDDWLVAGLDVPNT